MARPSIGIDAVTEVDLAQLATNLLTHHSTGGLCTLRSALQCCCEFMTFTNDKPHKCHSNRKLPISAVNMQARKESGELLLFAWLTDPGLPLQSEAPAMTPNGVDFFFWLTASFCLLLPISCNN